MWAGPESDDIDNIDDYDDLLDEDTDIIKLQYNSLGIQTVKDTGMNLVIPLASPRSTTVKPKWAIPPSPDASPKLTCLKPRWSIPPSYDVNVTPKRPPQP
eukprot:3390719-Ditylum_brightwellii.AAC.1